MVRVRLDNVLCVDNVDEADVDRLLVRRHFRRDETPVGVIREA